MLFVATVVGSVAAGPPLIDTEMADFTRDVFDRIASADGQGLARVVQADPDRAKRFVYDRIEHADARQLDAASRVAGLLDDEPTSAALGEFLRLGSRARRRALTLVDDVDALAAAVDAAEGPPGWSSIPYLRARGLRHLASRLLEEGRAGAARDRVNELLAVHESVGDSYSRGYDLFLAGRIAWRDGDAAVARRHLEESLALARRLGEGRLVRLAAPALAAQCAVVGDYADAMRLYLHAIEQAREPSARGRLRLRLAGMFTEVGLIADGEDAIRAALRDLPPAGDPVGHAMALTARAVVCLDADRAGEALDCVARARPLLEAAGDPARHALADALQYRAMALAQLARHRESREAFAAALAERTASGDALGRALALVGIGHSCLALDLEDEAATAFEGALAATDQLRGYLDARWRALAGLALVDARRGAEDGGLRRTLAAIDDIERVRHVLGASSLRLRYLGDKLSLYRRAVFLLARRGDLAQAYRMTGLASSRTLVEIGAQRPLAARASCLPEAAAGDLLAAERALLLAEHVAFGPDAGDDARARVDRARAAHQQARIAAELEARRVTALVGMAEPPTLEQVRSWLEPGAALLDYVIDAKRAGVWLMTSTTEPCFVELDTREATLEAAIDAIHGPIEELAAGRTDLGNVRFDAAAAAALYRVLIAPLRDRLAGCDTLWIVADGALRRLPFALLVRDWQRRRVDPHRLYAQYGGCRFLIEDHAIAYLPGAALLAPGAGGSIAGGASRGLVLADPRPLPAGAAALRHARGEAAAVRSQLESSGAGASGGNGEAAVDVWTGEQASFERLRDLDEALHTLHFAVHGALDDRRPAYSRLALAGAWMHAYDVERLRIPGARVVLSACSTVGESARGEGFLGLARAFLLAGARSVVATAWVVEDRAAADFMRVYYEALAGGESGPAALRRAQLDFVRGGQRDGMLLLHPLFWAGYLHIGR